MRRVALPATGAVAVALGLLAVLASLRAPAVIALCERLGETKVATLDRRRFGAVRPRHCLALTLLPQVPA